MTNNETSNETSNDDPNSFETRIVRSRAVVDAALSKLEAAPVRSSASPIRDALIEHEERIRKILATDIHASGRIARYLHDGGMAFTEDSIRQRIWRDFVLCGKKPAAHAPRNINPGAKVAQTPPPASQKNSSPQAAPVAHQGARRVEI